MDELTQKEKEDHSRCRKKKDKRSGELLVSGQNNAEVARRQLDEFSHSVTVDCSHLGRGSFDRTLCGYLGVLSHGHSVFRWTYAGGAISWRTPRQTMLRAAATIGERVAFAQETDGWLASDEMVFLLSKLNTRDEQFRCGPLMIYLPHSDDFMTDADSLRIPNRGTTLIPIILGPHWVGLEIHRDQTPIRVVFFQVPPACETCCSFLATKILQIPAHRLQIEFDNMGEIPGMCGWTILHRWIIMTQMQRAFADVPQQILALPVDRRRIVTRLLEKSSEAWAKTGAHQDLQFVAYQLRAVFFAHLFQQQTSVHQRLDSNAIVALGQPIELFAVSPPLPDPPVEVVIPDVTRQMSDAICQSNVTFAHVDAPERQGDPRVTQQVHVRLEAMWAQVNWAGSDEIDHQLNIYRHFTCAALLPCLIWDHTTNTLRFAGGIGIDTSFASVVYAIISFRSHWFGIKLTRLADFAVCEVYDTSPMDPDEWNRFLHQFAMLCQGQMAQIAVHFVPINPPEGMCGFVALWYILRDCQVWMTPNIETMVLRIQRHPQANSLVEMCNQAVLLWDQVCADDDLVGFANVVRVQFLDHLLRTQTCQPFCLAGARNNHDRSSGAQTSRVHDTSRDSPTGATLTQSALAVRFDRFLQTRVGEARHPGPNRDASDPIVAVVGRLKEFRPMMAVCECNANNFAAMVKCGMIHEEDENTVSVHAELISHEWNFPDGFQGMSLLNPPCQHTKTSQGLIRMHRKVWYRPDRPDVAWMLDAKIMNFRHGFMVDATDPKTCLYFRDELALDDDGGITKGELFCGGFSGWTQVGPFICKNLSPLRCVFALDGDLLAATTYARNYGSGTVVREAKEVQESSRHAFSTVRDQLTFLSDVRAGWWCQFTPHVRLLTMSPPCPSWSMANHAYGLARSNGFLTIEAFLKMTVLQAEVVCFENVAHFRQHHHYHIILAVLHWLGWVVRWETVADLNDILPQRRERFLMILTRKDSHLKPSFEFQGWDKREGLTLRNCDILRPRDCLSHMHVPRLTPEILRMYMHPRMIPGDGKGDFKTAKAYRLRTADQSVACVMAQYGHAHDLGFEVLQKSGLFGNLVIDHDIIRWLSIPEIANLMGLWSPWKAPLDTKQTYHMLGNAIATPHALLCLVNAVCLFPHVPADRHPKVVITEALSQFLSGSIQEVLLDAVSNEISIGAFQVSPTLPWSMQETSLSEWHVPAGPWFQKILVQPGVPMAAALKAIFPNAVGSAIMWRSQAFPDNPIPLTADDVAGFRPTKFDGTFGFMRLREGDFTSRKLSIVVVSLPSGPVLLKKGAMTTIPDIRRMLGALIPPSSLANDLWGFPGDQGALCADTVAFCMPCQETPPGEIIDQLTWVEDDIGWHIQAEHMTLLAYTRFAQKIGLCEQILRMGWILTIRPLNHDNQATSQLLFRPRIEVPSVDGLFFRTACTTTIAMSLMPPEIPTRSELIVKVKFWETWSPEFTWPRTTLVNDVVRPWSRASQHTGDRSEVRAIYMGKQMSNEFLLQSYLPPASAQTVMRIHCVLQLHGGGNKVEAAQQLRQGLVEFFLQSGADPLQVNDHAKFLVEKAGTATVQHAFQIRDPEERLVQLQRLAKALNLRALAIEHPDVDRQKKMRAWKPKALSQVAAVRADDFQLIGGHFATADGQALPVISWQTKNPVGVLLIDADAYLEYAKTITTQPHALGVAILGHECPIAGPKCSKLHVAATDTQGVKVILKSCFHQLGKFPVQPITKEGDNIPVAETKLAAITAWKEEMQSETWDNLLQSPAKVCAQVLAIKPSEHYGVAPWGRAFRAGNMQSPPESATSFQFHVRLRCASLEVLLRRSGQEGIYIVPKSDTLHRADEQYAIVWLGDRTLAQVKEFALTVDKQLGLARANNGTTQYGLRVYADAFEATFKLAFPLKPVPPHMITHYLAKVAPVPVGATHENMRDWLLAQNIQGKPLRALNSTTWLLSTVDQPTTDAVILSPILSKQDRSRPTVLAGQQVRPSPELIDLETSEDWLQSHDPWAEWKSTSSSSGG